MNATVRSWMDANRHSGRQHSSTDQHSRAFRLNIIQHYFGVAPREPKELVALAPVAAVHGLCLHRQADTRGRDQALQVLAGGVAETSTQQGDVPPPGWLPTDISSRQRSRFIQPDAQARTCKWRVQSFRSDGCKEAGAGSSSGKRLPAAPSGVVAHVSSVQHDIKPRL